MILPIVQTPEHVLNQIAKPCTVRNTGVGAKRVVKFDDKIHALIQDMKETLNATKDPLGVGLAAPQVGKSLRIFIMKPTEKSPVEVVVNPTVKEIIDLKQNTPKKKRRSVKLEGCLSIQTIWGKVNRPSSVVLSYIDEKGIPHTRKFTGFKATIIQHEYDHLQGILFTKRVLEQKGKLYRSKKDEKGEDIFEEIEI